MRLLAARLFITGLYLMPMQATEAAIYLYPYLLLCLPRPRHQNKMLMAFSSEESLASLRREPTPIDEDNIKIFIIFTLIMLFTLRERA